MKNHVLDLIGDTPLVKIGNLNPNSAVDLLAKLEGCNPGGSVKDRIALKMIQEAVISMNLENFREEETEQSDVKTVSPSFWKKEASRLKKLASEL